MPVDDLVDAAAFNLPWAVAKEIVERAIRVPHSQLLIEDHKRFPHRLYNGAGVIAGAPDFIHPAFQVRDIDQQQDGAIDPVVPRAIGPNAHQVAASLEVFDFLLMYFQDAEDIP